MLFVTGTTLSVPSLTGTLQGFVESPIYARTNGYVCLLYTSPSPRDMAPDLV
ncbi:hypothetical protein [Ralstonia sp. ASV6]|uniref:hypothetical protein n=1 Tax=Ralstonia sp. ASV6 TaxID=2795124 RepID=UPI0018EACBF4|nr:hypothetical protein [Ralstonia sp. ASV6]